MSPSASAISESAVPNSALFTIAELEFVRGRLGLPVERDLYFNPTKMLSAFADEAWKAGGIRT
jgi:Protein of unknown function (DUF2958)